MMGQHERRILTQLAIVEDFGGNDIRIATELPPDQLPPDLMTRSKGATTVMIEFVDPMNHTDHLVELVGVREIIHRERPSLFPLMKIEGGSQSPRRNEIGDDAARQAIARAERLQERVDTLQARVNDHEGEIRKLREKLTSLEERIGTVEVWTFDNSGVIRDHYVLGVDDVGEEIPIGNVVVSLNKERD